MEEEKEEEKKRITEEEEEKEEKGKKEVDLFIWSSPILSRQTIHDFFSSLFCLWGFVDFKDYGCR